MKTNHCPEYYLENSSHSMPSAGKTGALLLALKTRGFARNSSASTRPVATAYLTGLLLKAQTVAVGRSAVTVDVFSIMETLYPILMSTDLEINTCSNRRRLSLCTPTHHPRPPQNLTLFLRLLPPDPPGGTDGTETDGAKALQVLQKHAQAPPLQLQLRPQPPLQHPHLLKI